MKKIFFDIFAIHSSSRHEKRCQLSLRLFPYFEALYTNSVIIPFSAPCIHENIGNMQCEAAQNHAACEYDGGDCCLHWGRYASSNTKNTNMYNKVIKCIFRLHCATLRMFTGVYRVPISFFCNIYRKGL